MMMSEYGEQKTDRILSRNSIRRNSPMQVDGKVVFITGTNRGIGKSPVKASLKLGAKKVYAGARQLAGASRWNDSRVSNVRLT